MRTTSNTEYSGGIENPWENDMSESQPKKLLQISTFQHGHLYVAHFGEWDGATDGRNYYSFGTDKKGAIMVLKAETDWGNIPPEAIKAFELEMAEQGIPSDDWCDTFGEWLEENCEVVA